MSPLVIFWQRQVKYSVGGDSNIKLPETQNNGAPLRNKQQTYAITFVAQEGNTQDKISLGPVGMEYI